MVSPRDGAPTSPPPSRRSRRNLTYREKLAIIHKKEEEPSWTQRNLALWAKETFRLESKPTQATISNLLRGKDKLLTAAVPPEFRSARRVKYPELDQRMLLWVHEELQRGESVTRLSIQTQAIDLAQEMQLPADLTFSKGWVSSFMNRHQLNFSRKNGDSIAQQEAARQGMLAVTAEAVKRAEQQLVQQIQIQEQKQQIQKQEQVQETEEEEEEEPEDVEVAVMEVDNSVEVEEDQEVKEQIVEEEQVAPTTPLTTSIVREDPSPRQSVKRRKVDTRNGSSCSAWESMPGVSEEERATRELLLDWIAVPGSYSRWWLLKRDEEKEPLCDEINLFLRSHGLRGMSSADIRLQLTTLVLTFQAAHTWLRQARVGYPLNNKELTLEQEAIKSHVFQMCPHYERLVYVLAAYVNYDDNAANAAQSNEASVTATVQTTVVVDSDTAPVTQAHDTAVVVDTPPKPAKQENTEYTADSIDDETKAQKRRLFELECARLQSEIETRNIQLVLEKTLARKKLLDAGISAKEVDRIFPL